MDNLYSYEILGNIIPNAKYNKFSNNLIFTNDINNKQYKYAIFVNEYNEEEKEYNTYILLSETKFNENCKLCTKNEYNQIRINVVYSLIQYFKTHSRVRLNIVDSTNDYDKFDIVAAG